MGVKAYVPMLRIDREVHADVSATPKRCRELLTDVPGYPSWSSLITSAEPSGDHVRLRAELLGVSFEMLCELEVGDRRVVLRRLPEDEGDEERFEAAFTLGQPGAVALHVTACIDAPGPARLIRGQVERRLADGLLADFTRAL